MNEVPSKLEWRLADNEPIAVIYRLKGPSKVCAEQLGLPMSSEMLFVAGLGKHAAASGRVSAKSSNANSKAREIADRGFSDKAK